jgi:hypothetical protein
MKSTFTTCVMSSCRFFEQRWKTTKREARQMYTFATKEANNDANSTVVLFLPRMSFASKFRYWRPGVKPLRSIPNKSVSWTSKRLLLSSTYSKSSLHYCNKHKQRTTSLHGSSVQSCALRQLFGTMQTTTSRNSVPPSFVECR